MQKHVMSLLLTAGLAAASLAQAQNLTLPEPPADAAPGECYGLVYVPPVMRERHEEKLVAEATERLEKVPAVYEYVEKQVTLPATRRRKVITPAVTETVEDSVIVPGGTRRIAVPATYKTIEKEVTLEQGAQLKTSKLLDGGDGEAICLVEAPTAKQTVKERVVARPAGSKLVETEPKLKVVKKKKIITPAVTEWVPVPERTVTRRTKQLVVPESWRSVPVPARYETVVRKEIEIPARAEWQRVLCETNFTPALVQSLQEALKREGEYQGATNGKMSPQTASAVRRFQERNNLPTGGLSLSTLAYLGVSLSDGQSPLQ